MPHSFVYLKKHFQDMMDRGLHPPQKGYVVLHENSSVLSELGRFYAVAEIEDIETTLDEIRFNGIEVPLNQPPPDILEDIVSQSKHYFVEMINATNLEKGGSLFFFLNSSSFARNFSGSFARMSLRVSSEGDSV